MFTIPDTNPDGIYTITATATDNGGRNSNDPITVTLDNTASTISGAASPTANGAGWNKTDVTVTFIYGDTGGSGIANCTLPVTKCEGAGQTVLGTAVDNVGNANTDTVSNINIDKTNPVVTPPADQTLDATSPAGSTATFAPTAVDPLSDVDSLASVPTSGSVFPIGTTTVTHTAIDVAGNSASATHTVTVLSPKGMKADAKSTLEGLTGSDKHSQKELDKAIEHLVRPWPMSYGPMNPIRQKSMGRRSSRRRRQSST